MQLEVWFGSSPVSLLVGRCLAHPFPGFWFHDVIRLHTKFQILQHGQIWALTPSLEKHVLSSTQFPGGTPILEAQVECAKETRDHIKRNTPLKMLASTNNEAIRQCAASRDAPHACGSSELSGAPNQQSGGAF
jgi:hypothetical protein